MQPLKPVWRDNRFPDSLGWMFLPDFPYAMGKERGTGDGWAATKKSGLEATYKVPMRRTTGYEFEYVVPEYPELG
jgi:hypothetical protein